ncbi:hypothetical protein T484DRAFT_1923177 [Baffinella frigidus]|nr:hypothetical protein T484DRAFT_1923177 [Cryptophyta sp. CCMP2293]
MVRPCAVSEEKQPAAADKIKQLAEKSLEGGSDEGYTLEDRFGMNKSDQKPQNTEGLLKAEKVPSIPAFPRV